MSAKSKVVSKGKREKNAYAEYQARRMREAKNGYFVVVRDDTARFTPDEVLVLHHLLAHGKSNADEDGWMMSTTNHLRDGTGLDDGAQRSVLDSLQRMRLVEVQYQRGEGRRQVRYLRVMLARLEDYVTGRLAVEEQSEEKPKRRQERDLFGYTV